jgi:hypothetical protein
MRKWLIAKALQGAAEMHNTSIMDGRDSVEPKLDFLGRSHGSTGVALPFPVVTDAMHKSVMRR